MPDLRETIEGLHVGACPWPKFKNIKVCECPSELEKARSALLAVVEWQAKIEKKHHGRILRCCDQEKENTVDAVCEIIKARLEERDAAD